MRNRLALIVLLAGCDGFLQPKVASSTKLVDRVYRMASCRQTFGDQLEAPVPCVAYVAGTYSYVTDSARVVLRADGTAAWFHAERMCNSSGQSCGTEGIDSSSGTYRFGRDSVLVHLPASASVSAHDLVFIGSVPDRVSSDWDGPDVLTFNLSNGAYLGVFKP
jgi:hypothetical protein